MATTFISPHGTMASFPSVEPTPVNEESLFIQALRIKNLANRKALLRKACADDEQLKKRAKGLL